MPDISKASAEAYARLVAETVTQALDPIVALLGAARAQHDAASTSSSSPSAPDLLPSDIAQETLTPQVAALQEQLKSAALQYTKAQSDDLPATGPADRLRTIAKENTVLALRGFVIDRLPAHAASEPWSEGNAEDVGLSSDSARALFDRLDVVIAFDEAELIDQASPLQILEDIFECLPIPSCSVLFSFVESRLHLLTVDLSPSRGKGLTLLRLCNDLLRRFSKPSRPHTVFAGRVLSTLSAVFPLGERSGVNLRGDFNVENRTIIEPLPEAPEEAAPQEAEEEEEEVKPLAEAAETAADGDGDTSMRTTSKPATRAPSPAAVLQPDLNTPEGLAAMCSSPAFYALFWSLQSYFSQPALLFEPEANAPLPAGDDPAPDGAKGPMAHFRIATSVTLKVFAAAAKRERQLAGAAASEGASARAAAEKIEAEKQAAKTALAQGAGRPDAGEAVDRQTVRAGTRKRKADEEDMQDEQAGETEESDFFPKYLTGRNLLEYELRDPLFRRHVCVQWLILFQYLLSFTPTQREKWSTWKNKTLQNITFVLNEADDTWVRGCWREIIGQLKNIPPEGKMFSDSVLQTLKRESRWIGWKTDNCPPIDKPSLSAEQVIAFAKARSAPLKRMPGYPHKLGTAALTQLWDNGLAPPEPSKRRQEDAEGNEIEVTTDGLDDLEFPPHLPDLDDYARQVAAQEAKAKARREELGWEAPDPAPLAPIAGPAQDKAEREKENQEWREKLQVWRTADDVRLAREREDAQLVAIEEQRQTLAWRALRLASRKHLNLITPAIRVDDITALMQAIEEEQRAPSRSATSATPAATGPADARSPPALDDAAGSPSSQESPASGPATQLQEEDAAKVDAEDEADVKTEDVDMAPAQPVQEEEVIPKQEEDASMEDAPISTEQ